MTNLIDRMRELTAEMDRRTLAALDDPAFHHELARLTEPAVIEARIQARLAPVKDWFAAALAQIERQFNSSH